MKCRIVILSNAQCRISFISIDANGALNYYANPVNAKLGTPKVNFKRVNVFSKQTILHSKNRHDLKAVAIFSADGFIGPSKVA